MSLLFLQHMSEPFIHRVGKSPLVRARTTQLASSAPSSAGWLSFSHITSREIVRKFYDEKRSVYLCLRDHTGCVSLFFAEHFLHKASDISCATAGWFPPRSMHNCFCSPSPAPISSLSSGDLQLYISLWTRWWQASHSRKGDNLAR